MEPERAKALLAAERIRITKMISALEREMVLTQPSGEAAVRSTDDLAEAEEEWEEHEWDHALLSATNEGLWEIDAAESRLADGTYGRCETCSEPIPDERLEALPATRTCIKHHK